MTEQREDGGAVTLADLRDLFKEAEFQASRSLGRESKYATYLLRHLRSAAASMLAARDLAARKETGDE